MGIKDKRDNKKFSRNQAQKKNECRAAELTNTLSLRYITDNEKYSRNCFKDSNHSVFSSLLDKFKIITTLTWDMFWAKSKQSGLEKMPAEEFSDQSLINSLNLPKGTTIYVARFNGQNSRLIFRRGTKCGRVVHILGFDLNLESYHH